MYLIKTSVRLGKSDGWNPFASKVGLKFKFYGGLVYMTMFGCGIGKVLLCYFVNLLGLWIGEAFVVI